MTGVADDLVVGGGLAGAACAATLSAAGRHVVLLERERGDTDRLCGEFIGTEALHHLRALEIDVRALGAAPIDTMRLSAGRQVAERSLGFAAYALSRRVLDGAVRARARAAGADIRLGSTVEALSRVGEDWRVRLRNGGSATGRAVFLATGKHDLRGWKRRAAAPTSCIAFKQHWRLARRQQVALDGAVELTLFPGGYAGLAPVDGGRANLCLLVKRARFERAGGRWDALLEDIRRRSPLLDERLDGGAPCTDRPLAVAAIPFGWLWRGRDGSWRLGDQAAVVPSFTGSGMSVALVSAALASSCRLRGEAPERYHDRLARALAQPLGKGMRLSPLMMYRPAQIAVSAMARLVPPLIDWGIGATRLPHAP